MRRKLPPIALPALTLWVCLLAPSARAQINVVTEHYDLNRTGANLQEHLLNTTTVESTNNSFGKLSGQWAGICPAPGGIRINDPGIFREKKCSFHRHNARYALRL